MQRYPAMHSTGEGRGRVGGDPRPPPNPAPTRNNPEASTLVVRPVKSPTQKDELRALLEPYASRTSCPVVAINVVIGRNMAFVDFEGPEAVTAVLQDYGQEDGGTSFELGHGSPLRLWRKSDSMASFQNRSGGSGRDGGKIYDWQVDQSASASDFAGNHQLHVVDNSIQQEMGGIRIGDRVSCRLKSGRRRTGSCLGFGGTRLEPVVKLQYDNGKKGSATVEQCSVFSYEGGGGGGGRGYAGRIPVAAFTAEHNRFEIGARTATTEICRGSASAPDNELGNLSEDGDSMCEQTSSSLRIGPPKRKGKWDYICAGCGVNQGRWGNCTQHMKLCCPEVFENTKGLQQRLQIPQRTIPIGNALGRENVPHEGVDTGPIGTKKTLTITDKDGNAIDLSGITEKADNEDISANIDLSDTHTPETLEEALQKVERLRRQLNHADKTIKSLRKEVSSYKQQWHNLTQNHINRYDVKAEETIQKLRKHNSLINEELCATKRLNRQLYSELELQSRGQGVAWNDAGGGVFYNQEQPPMYAASSHSQQQVPNHLMEHLPKLEPPK